LNFKKWVKSIQTAAYNGACTVFIFEVVWCLSDADSRYLTYFFLIFT
jgi:hypothetical protein